MIEVERDCEGRHIKKLEVRRCKYFIDPSYWYSCHIEYRARKHVETIYHVMIRVSNDTQRLE